MRTGTRIALMVAATIPAGSAVVGGQAPSRTQAVRPVGPGIVGYYAFRNQELSASIDLRADHSFEYRVDGLGSPVGDEGPLHLLVRGVWRFTELGNIALTNAPTAPPVFRQTSAVHDSSVRAAFTIVTTDGKPVEDLGVRTDDGANGQLNMLANDSWTIPLLHPWNTDDGDKGSPTRLPRNLDIVRSSDNLSLVRITLTQNGPNRFMFSYTRSPIDPFMLAAGPVKGEPDMIEVELGTASLKMHRTSK
jgi:hypothetical protein